MSERSREVILICLLIVLGFVFFGVVKITIAENCKLIKDQAFTIQKQKEELHYLKVELVTTCPESRLVEYSDGTNLWKRPTRHPTKE